MQKKVIYLRYIPLTQKIEQDFYLRTLIDNGICVEYWDISKLFDFVPSDLETYESSIQIKVRKFASYKDLKDAISINRDSLFWLIMTLEPRLFRLWFILSKYNCKKIVFANLPVAFKSAVKASYDIFNPRLLLNRMINVLMRTLIKTGILRGYEYMFLGGSEGWRGVGLIKPSMLNTVNILKVHSIAYNNYLKVREKHPIIKGKYIVFLDQYLPFHPDNAICGLVPPPPDIYYSVINKALEVLERYYNIPVIIAAHPKALKYHDTNFYNGRDVIFYNTENLIVNSELVVLHNSTALSTAIISQKNILFLEATCIEKVNKSFNDDILYLSSYLDFPCLKAESLSIELLQEINRTTTENQFIYEDYKRCYLTSYENNSILNETLIPQIISKIFEDNE